MTKHECKPGPVSQPRTRGHGSGNREGRPTGETIRGGLVSNRVLVQPVTWVVSTMMGRTKITFGLLIAAFAAAGLWSSLHQLAQIRASAHGHDSLVVLLAPHHAFTVLGPLTPVLLLIAAAMRARQQSNGSWLPDVGARELVGSCVLLEGAELASGSMAHSWAVTSALVLVARTVSLLLAVLAVTVVRFVARHIVLMHGVREVVPLLLNMLGRDDVIHPSLAWLARRSRRGPPAFLPAAA